MIPLIVIRPQPGCDASVKAAAAMGLDTRGFPLFEVHSLDWDMPEPGSFDAVLLGSANALRHGGEGLAALAGTPAYAVGEATASACRAGAPSPCSWQPSPRPWDSAVGSWPCWPLPR